jgi:polar amino acid transport system substrate-binding protein
MSQEKFISSGHPEWPPIMYQSGDKIVGVGPELVQKIFNELDVNIESQYVGLWDEAQAKARTGEVDVLVAAYKTAEREAYMDYSIPYTVDSVALFVKKGSDFKFAKWEDLIGKKGVATVGDSYGQDLDDFIKAKLDIRRVDTAKEAFDMVEAGNVDYFVYAMYSGEKKIAEDNLGDKIQIMPTYVTIENFYITISKKSPLIKYLDQINVLIAKHKADGTIDRLIEKYKSQYLK